MIQQNACNSLFQYVNVGIFGVMLPAQTDSWS